MPNTDTEHRENLNRKKQSRGRKYTLKLRVKRYENSRRRYEIEITERIKEEQIRKRRCIFKSKTEDIGKNDKILPSVDKD